MSNATTTPRLWSREPITGVLLMATAIGVGGWLLREIHRTIGLNAPRFWELLKTDRVFDVAMLDFFLTAGWALLVLVERSRRRDWRFWLSLGVFMAIPTIGIALFLILGCGKPRIDDEPVQGEG
jgi:hypothetical protein